MSRRYYPSDPTNTLDQHLQQPPQPPQPTPFNPVNNGIVQGQQQPNDAFNHQPNNIHQPYQPNMNQPNMNQPYQQTNYYPQPVQSNPQPLNTSPPPPPVVATSPNANNINNVAGGGGGHGKRMYPVDPSNTASLVSGMQNMNMQQPQVISPTPAAYQPVQPIQQQQQPIQQQSPYPIQTTNSYLAGQQQQQPVQQQQPLQSTPYSSYQQQQPIQQQPPHPYPQQQPVTSYQPNQPQQPIQQPTLQSSSQQPMVYQEVLPTLENNCPKSFMRMSINAVPNLAATLGKVHIPFGCSIQPLANDPHNEVPLVSSSIVRCKRVSCKAYINPFVIWMDGGGRWKCNVCDLVNDISQEYFSPIDMTTGKRSDIANRPELQRGCVEFLATREYTVRAPQPPSYFFVIDVCYESIVSGMLNCAIEAIKTSLDNLPGDSRTRVGFMTFDDSLHFYNLRSSTGKPQMFVVTEMDSIYVPPFDDFLVNLKESRTIVDNLLEIIRSMERKQQKVVSCLGTALKAAYQICHRVGGKIIVLQSYIPRGEYGKLQVRDYQQILGTKKESMLLQPSDLGEFYKEFGLNCSSQQLSVDVFLFGTDYVDTASLGCMTQITGGELYYYPSFIASRDGQTFAANLIHTLTRTTGWESVMRVRTSRQLNINVYHGNYFLKSSDLLSLSTVDQDKTYTLQMSVNDTITAKHVAIQAALLYTHSSGERRVRVLTTCVPVVNSYVELFRAADVSVVTSLISKMAIDKALASSLNDAREAIANKCVDILTAYKSTLGTAGGANMLSVTLSSSLPKLLLPESLKHLPLYVVAMVKNIVFTSRHIHPDMRAFHMQRMKTVDLISCLNFFYPQFYNLLSTPLTNANGEQLVPSSTTVPTTLKLSSDQLSRAGIFAIVNGFAVYLYVGEALDPQICHQIFDTDFANLDPMTFHSLPILDNPHSHHARKTLESARSQYPQYQRVILVKSNDRQKLADFQSLLVEDRTSEGTSYFEFLTQLQTRVSQKN